jgi:hypothetical protein
MSGEASPHDSHYLALEDHVSVVSKQQVLSEESNKGKHCQASIGDLLVLVFDPAFVAIVYPVGSSEHIARYVAWTSLDLLCQPFHSSTSQNELKPADKGQLCSSLERVAGKLAVECRVDSGSCNKPSETRRHADTAVLELGFTVIVHDLVALVAGETKGIEKASGCQNSNRVVVLPCRDGGDAAGCL